MKKYCGFLFVFLFSVMTLANQNKRYAELSVVVTKMTYTEKDGGYFIPEKVCEEQAKIEVVGEGEGPSEGFYRIECPTKVAGEDAAILVGGLVQLSSRKLVRLGLWVEPDSDIHKLLTVNLTVGTDPENKRLDAILEPYVDMDCRPVDDENMQCTPTLIREYFTVNAVVTD